MMEKTKLIWLLKVVVENYITKGEPVWSKFLHTLKNNEYAPELPWENLNILEKEWFSRTIVREEYQQ